MKNISKYAVFLSLALPSAWAVASDVQLYGQIDTGIAFEKGDGAKGKVMSAGSADIPSKWGIRGKEDLGGKSYLAFNLENGFNPYNGTATWGADFGREALIILGGSWGELALGRTGTFFGSIGSYGMWAKMGINPMQTNYGDSTLGGVFTSTGMASNSVTYQYRTNNNWIFTAQYLNGDDDSQDTWSHNNHMYEAAVQYKDKLWNVGVIYAMTQYGNVASNKIAPHNAKLSKNIMASITRAVGKGRLYFAYQHVWDSRVVGGANGQFSAAQMGINTAKISKEGFDSDAAMIGGNMPAFGGKIYGAFKAVHAKWKGEKPVGSGRKTSGFRWVVSGKYRYDLSKRSSLYAETSYAHGSGMYGFTNEKGTRLQFVTGVSHRF